MKHLTDTVALHKQGKAKRDLRRLLRTASVRVLESALRFAHAHHTPLLIEATSNQVDQFGGYTGMTPARFPRLCLPAR